MDRIQNVLSRSLFRIISRRMMIQNPNKNTEDTNLRINAEDSSSPAMLAKNLFPKARSKKV